MFVNPLVNLWFFLSFSFSLLLSDTPGIWGIHGLIFFTVTIKHWDRLPALGKRILPFILSFPLMLIFYIGFSLWFTDNILIQILAEAGTAFLRLILIVGAMSLFFVITPTQDVLRVIRSLWVKQNLSWRLGEDFILFLGMTLRFYPTFQNDWTRLNESRTALGLKGSTSYLSRIKTAALDLPGLLLHNLQRAEDVATVMRLRGYGKHFPRGVTYPIPLKTRHFIQTIVITLIFIGIHQFASF